MYEYLQYDHVNQLQIHHFYRVLEFPTVILLEYIFIENLEQC